KELAVGHTRPSVRAEFQAEQDYPVTAGGLRLEITAAERQTARRAEVNVFRVGDRLSPWNDEEGLFLKDANDVILKATDSVEVEAHRDRPGRPEHKKDY